MAQIGVTMLQPGTEHRFDSAGRSLRVTGRISYDGGLVRYAVEGDADVHAIDRFETPRRERALNRLAEGDVALEGESARYFGEVFPLRARVRRHKVEALGELGDSPAFGADIEEQEFARPQSRGRFLLRVIGAEGALWFLAAEMPIASVEVRAAAAATDRAKAASGELVAALASAAACLLLAGSLLTALPETSSSHADWSNVIREFLALEFVLVAAGTMSAMMSQGVQDRASGKVGSAPLWVPLAFLVMGAGYALAIFKFGLLFLLYMGRLAALIWTGLTVTPGHAQRMIQRRAFGAMAFVATTMAAVTIFGNTNRNLMGAFVVYFTLLALIELIALPKASEPSHSE